MSTGRERFEVIREAALRAGTEDAEHHDMLTAIMHAAIDTGSRTELIKVAGKLTAWVGDLLDAIESADSTAAARLDAKRILARINIALDGTES